MGITVEELLAGPRGRLLCLNLALAWEETQAQAAAASAARSLVAAPVCPVRLPLSDAVWQADAALDPDPRGSSYNLPYPEENRALALEDIDAAWAQPLAARRRARQDAEALIATAARACQSIAARVPLPGTLLWALADTAGAARGWQAPAGIDVLLAQPALVSALRPVAQAVTNSPAVDWWSRGMDPQDQWIELQESDGSAWSWRLRGNIRKVWDEWAQHRAEEEAEGFSSTWWTSPVTFGQDSPPITHGTLPSAACDASGAPAERPHGDAELAVAGTPTGFLIQEDSGPVGPLMQAGRLLPQAAPRVLEIDSEAAWVSACTAFPLDVSRSYGPQARLALYLVDEPRATTWVIPDWGEGCAGVRRGPSDGWCLSRLRHPAHRGTRSRLFGDYRLGSRRDVMAPLSARAGAAERGQRSPAHLERGRRRRVARHHERSDRRFALRPAQPRRML